MYKKRFAKWGLQKNTRRSAGSTPTSTASVKSDLSPSEAPYSVPASPELGGDDSLMLTLLTSVRAWNISFYEFTASNKEGSPPTPHSWPERYHDMNFTFKLMIDVLDRGHGDLAGRVARKAFLLVEEALMLAGPALLWNMLEIMHFMMTSHHVQLFQLLLAHMRALVDVRLSKSHPLPTILRALGAFMADSWGSAFVPQSTLPASSPRPASTDTKEQVVTNKTGLSSHVFLSVIEQAWKLNAEILFQNFHHRLFQLYLRVHWDTCSIEPPAAMFAAAKQWMALVTPHQTSGVTAGRDQSEDYVQITPFEEDRMLQSLLVAPTYPVLPEDYEVQQMNSIKVLRDHAISILGKKSSPAGDSSMLLRILANLVTAKVLEEWCAAAHGSDTDGEMTSMLSRGQAGNIACALRTTMYLDVDKHGVGTHLDTAGQIRSILALREYAKSGTDPRIVQEMLLLEDVLVAAGEYRKASEVKRTAFQRLEQYIQDVPIHSV